MWEEFLGQVLANGVWASMFVFLLIYVLRDGKARENAYMQTVRELTQRLKVVEQLAAAVGDVAQNTESILVEIAQRGNKVWKKQPKLNVIEGEEKYEHKSKVEVR